jgi:5-methylcytosine-specific restriction enzyme A
MSIFPGRENMPRTAFKVGKTYTRSQVFDQLNLQPHPTGGNWFTGYHTHDNTHFIFCGIGTAGRTGHDYNNRWVGVGVLEWYGKTSATANQPLIRRMTDPNAKVHLFYREDDRNPFTYGGLLKARKVVPVRPVKVIWEVVGIDRPVIPEELPQSDEYIEGARKRIEVNAYERDPKARAACLKHYGYACSVCEIVLEDIYGSIAARFVHVHHLVRLGSIGKSYRVDPVADLRPVCPNCHSILHREDPPLSIKELRKLVRGRS